MSPSVAKPSVLKRTFASSAGLHGLTLRPTRGTQAACALPAARERGKEVAADIEALMGGPELGLAAAV